MLEMGEPIKILELAETMIRLSGLEPERDIAIEIVGARPGEKFHEDLFNPYEHPQPTPAQKILARRARARSTRPGSSARSATSTCSCWKVTPPRWRNTSPSCPTRAHRAGRQRWRPDRTVDCAPETMAHHPVRLLSPSLHQLGGCRRRLRRDHRARDPGAPVLRAGARDRHAARPRRRGRAACRPARGAAVAGRKRRARPGPAGRPASRALADRSPARESGAGSHSHRRSAGSPGRGRRGRGYGRRSCTRRRPRDPVGAGGRWRAPR